MWLYIGPYRVSILMKTVGDMTYEGGAGATDGSTAGSDADRTLMGGRRRFLQGVGALAVASSLAGCLGSNVGTHTASALGWKQLEGFAFKKHVPNSVTKNVAGFEVELTTQTLAYTSESGIAVGTTTMPDVEVAGQSIPNDPAKMSIDEFVKSEYGLAMFNGMDIVDERITSIEPVAWEAKTLGWNGPLAGMHYKTSTYTEQPQVRSYRVRAVDASGKTHDAWFLVTRGKTAKFGENDKGVTLVGAGTAFGDDTSDDAAHDLASETWTALRPAHMTLAHLTDADLKAM